MDASSEAFGPDLGRALRTAFAYMRGEAGGQGRRDVMGLLGDEAECSHLLRLLCPSPLHDCANAAIFAFVSMDTMCASS